MLTEKVCIVTGSGGGIGRATAQEMARRGAKVVVTDVNDETGEQTAGLIEQDGGEAIYVHCDVRQEEQIVALMKAAADRFGGIDVLHNNAGVHDTDFTSDTAVDTLPVEVWNKVYEINLRAPWLCTKHAAPLPEALRARPGDRQRRLDRRHGRVPDGALVLLHQGSGHHAHQGDRDRPRTHGAVQLLLPGGGRYADGPEVLRRRR